MKKIFLMATVLVALIMSTACISKPVASMPLEKAQIYARELQRIEKEFYRLQNQVYQNAEIEQQQERIKLVSQLNTIIKLFMADVEVSDQNLNLKTIIRILENLPL